MTDKSTTKHVVHDILQAIWFLFMIAMLITNAFIRPTYFCLGYFAIWIFMLFVFVFSFRLFRRLLIFAYTFLIVYSALIFTTLALYQIDAVSNEWNKWTGLNEKHNSDIGLEKFNEVGSIFLLDISLPLVLIAAIGVQLKVYHREWLAKFARKRKNSTAAEPEVRTEAQTFKPDFTVETVQFCSQHIYETIWRIAEMNIHRLVLITIVAIAVHFFSALNFIAIVLVTLAVCLSKFKRTVSLTICVYLSATFVAQFFPEIFVQTFNFKETINDANITRSNETFTQWIGIVQNWGFPELSIWVVVPLLIGVQFAIYYRQKYRRSNLGLREPPAGILFSDAIDAQLFDESLLSGFKVACNYCFYKFGLEFSMICMVFVAYLRMDVLAAIFISIVLILSLSNRIVVRVLWPLVVLYCIIEFPLQYAVQLGLPVSLGIQYPWVGILSSYDTENINASKHFLNSLDLPNYENAREQWDYRLFFDFILLMVVAAQWCVFGVESKHNSAGDNNSVCRGGNFKLCRDNPHYDFIGEQKSFVDYIKIGVFMYGHWITLSAFFAAGLGGTSLFALGYIILAFWMLWQGNELYTARNFKSTVSKWYVLCAYNVSTMLWKISLQIVGCVFALELDQSMSGWRCALRQLFSIVCLHDDFSLGKLGSCKVDDQETKILFDLVAFILIIFQLRILNSYLFQHCLVDNVCELIQANRGAILINQLVEKQMNEQRDQQKKQFRTIKERMTAIRQRYEKQFESNQCLVSEAYHQAKRAGDYYMFDYDPRVEEDVNPIEEHYVEEVTPGAGKFDKLDPTQVIHTAISKDMDLKGTLDAVEKAEKIEDEGKRMIEAVRQDEMNESSAKTATEHVFLGIQFTYKLFTAALHYVSAFFDRNSRENRYVTFVLHEEKTHLKASMKDSLYSTDQSIDSLRSEWKSQGKQMVGSIKDIEVAEGKVKDHWESRDVLTKFILSFVHVATAYSHVICYFFACIAHAYCGGLITLPLPMMVLFWGTLCNPRPPKAFWISMISYTEFIIVVKFVFQFGFYPWNKTSQAVENSISPFKFQYIFGVQKAEKFAAFDVILLISLFFHRYMLRKIGLWKNVGVTVSVKELKTASLKRYSVGSLTSMNQTAIEEHDISNDVFAQEENEKKLNGFQRFYYNLFYSKVRYIRDLYPVMLLLDVICILILTFRYSQFGEASSSSSVLASSRIPVMFVFMIFILILMLIVDRALYLRKAIRCKLVYQLSTIVLLHVWIFYILPLITGIKATENTAAKWFYSIKCLYFIASAWQIRNGFPQLCIGHFLTHSYGVVNYLLFYGYMIFPLLFEIRTIIDWTWTDTAMAFFDFMKLEELHARLYLVKCSRVMEDARPAPRGVPSSPIVKYTLGLSSILGVVFLILCPLLAFSLLNRIGEQNLPERVELTVSLEDFPAFYSMTSQGVDLIRPTNNQIKHEMTGWFKNSKIGGLSNARMAVSFVGDYSTSANPDIRLIRFRPESSIFWPISSESLHAMLKVLDTDTVKLNIQLEVVRKRNDGSAEPLVHSAEYSILVERNSTLSKQIKEALNNPGKSFQLPNALPYYLIVPSEGRLQDASTLLKSLFIKGDKGVPRETYSTLDIHHGIVNPGGKKLWVTKFLKNSRLESHSFDYETINYGNSTEAHDYIQIVVFVDRVFPNLINKFAKGGVLAMYIALVFVVARLIRSMLASNPLDVIIREMPNPDYVLKLCQDIYLVREARDFLLEEDLFAKLIFLFRSPQTLIKWSRYKVE